MKQKQKQEFSLNVGISSILFIFIVLCLVSFATLSLSSATSDQKLSKRVVANSENYFNACNEAEEQLASFDSTLLTLYESGISRAGYYEQVGHKKSYAIPVSDLQTLKVDIKVLYPEKSGDPFYEISSWCVITTGDLEYDNSLDVFK